MRRRWRPPSEFFIAVLRKIGQIISLVLSRDDSKGIVCGSVTD